MRKKTSSRTLLVTFVVLTFSSVIMSCHDEESSLKPDQDQTHQSEISRIEQKFGIELAKREITLVDESGKNKVTMMFAAVDEAVLDEYLQLRSHSITPVLKTDMRDLPKYESPSFTETSPQADDDSYDSRVTIEIVKAELQEGVIGFGIHVEENESYKLAGGARTMWNYVSEYIAWHPYWLDFANTSSTNDVGLTIKEQKHNLDDWDTWATVTLGPGQSTSRTVNGPFGVKLRVGYQAVGDFTFHFTWI